MDKVVGIHFGADRFMQMRITQGLRLPCQQNRVRVLQLCLNDK